MTGALAKGVGSALLMETSGATDMDALPRCVETKSLLSGRVQSFPCDLVEFGGDSGIILYRIAKPATVGRAALFPGCLSYGLFSSAHPFVTYCWFTGDMKEIAWYVNVADSVTLTRDEFRWRDLVVDVIVYTDGAFDVLDEEELPPDLDGALLERIHVTTTSIILKREAIVAECRWRLRPHT